MDIKVTLTDETMEVLKGFGKNGEKPAKLLARLLTDLSTSPKSSIKSLRAMMAPDWFQELGKGLDGDLAAKVLPDRAKGSAVQALSTVRNLMGVTAYRRQGHPRQYTDEDRMAKYTGMKSTGLLNSFSCTAIQTSLGFRKSDPAIEWAERHDLTELAEKLKEGRERGAKRGRKGAAAKAAAKAAAEAEAEAKVKKSA